MSCFSVGDHHHDGCAGRPETAYRPILRVRVHCTRVFFFNLNNILRLQCTKIKIDTSSSSSNQIKFQLDMAGESKNNKPGGRQLWLFVCPEAGGDCLTLSSITDYYKSINPDKTCPVSDVFEIASCVVAGKQVPIYLMSLGKTRWRSNQAAELIPPSFVAKGVWIEWREDEALPKQKLIPERLKWKEVAESRKSSFQFVTSAYKDKAVSFRLVERVNGYDSESFSCKGGEMVPMSEEEKENARKIRELKQRKELRRLEREEEEAAAREHLKGMSPEEQHEFLVNRELEKKQKLKAEQDLYSKVNDTVEKLEQTEESRKLAQETELLKEERRKAQEAEDREIEQVRWFCVRWMCRTDLFSCRNAWKCWGVFRGGVTMNGISGRMSQWTTTNISKSSTRDSTSTLVLDIGQHENHFLSVWSTSIIRVVTWLGGPLVLVGQYWMLGLMS